MGGVPLSFVILAVSFLLTSQVLPGVQAADLKGQVLAAALFGGVNALLGWFLTGAVTIVPIDLAYLLLFGTRWVVNSLLLVLLDTSAKILILKNVGTAVGAGVMITAMGTIAEYLLNTL
jgi:uncharacterized membrane protein YvlD (DUF360 family)